MKKLLLISLVLLTILFACKKENNLVDTGTIIGADMRECVCCGGWFIEISDSTYLFKEIPAGSNLDLERETFPVDVELKWYKDPESCLQEDIVVTYISKK